MWTKNSYYSILQPSAHYLILKIQGFKYVHTKILVRMECRTPLRSGLHRAQHRAGAGSASKPKPYEHAGGDRCRDEEFRPPGMAQHRPCKHERARRGR